eukprot:2935148-Pyramimonas_sp.AAC.1
MVEDDNYGLDSDENCQYVGLCITAEMLKVVLSEQQHMILDAARVITMRVYVTAAAKRAAVVTEDDFLAKVDIQAHRRPSTMDSRRGSTTSVSICKI